MQDRRGDLRRRAERPRRSPRAPAMRVGGQTSLAEIAAPNPSRRSAAASRAESGRCAASGRRCSASRRSCNRRAARRSDRRRRSARTRRSSCAAADPGRSASVVTISPRNTNEPRPGAIRFVCLPIQPRPDARRKGAFRERPVSQAIARNRRAGSASIAAATPREHCAHAAVVVAPTTRRFETRPRSRAGSARRRRRVGQRRCRRRCARPAERRAVRSPGVA